MDIYIKPFKKIKITERKIVYLKDIAEVFTAGSGSEGIKNIIVYNIKDNEKKTYLISVIDVIKAVTNKMKNENIKINNVGETDVLIEYSPCLKKDNSFLMGLKIVFIVIILFLGAATAIMSFHSDAELNQIFKGYYYMFFQKEIENPTILEIPYSIGLAVGIIVFFNHFSKASITQDPTPIEVQMSTYETEVIKSTVDELERNEKNPDKGEC